MNTGNYAIDHAATILYNDESVIIADMGCGTGRVYVYKLTDYKTPLRGENRREWLACGVWKRVICGFRETEVYGSEPLTVRDLAGIAEQAKK